MPRAGSSNAANVLAVLNNAEVVAGESLNRTGSCNGCGDTCAPKAPCAELASHLAFAEEHRRQLSMLLCCYEVELAKLRQPTGSGSDALDIDSIPVHWADLRADVIPTERVSIDRYPQAERLRSELAVVAPLPFHAAPPALPPAALPRARPPPGKPDPDEVVDEIMSVNRDSFFADDFEADPSVSAIRVKALPCWDEGDRVGDWSIKTKERRGLRTQQMLGGLGDHVVEEEDEEELMGHTPSLKEADRSFVRQRLMISPQSKRRCIWDVLSLLLVLYDLILIPLVVFEFQESQFMLAMQWVTRIFWTVDMPMSLVSGFVTPTGSIEMRPKVILRRYFRTWFGIDMIIIGSDWLEVMIAAVFHGSFAKVTRVFRIARTLRLLRLMRMKETLSAYAEYFESDILVIVVDLAKLLISMLASSHVLGCIWYAVGNLDASGWVHHYNYNEKSLNEAYVMAVRWGQSQFSGGMDEISPTNFREHGVAIVATIMFFLGGTVFQGTVTSSMTQLGVSRSSKTQSMTMLRRYLTQNGISKMLKTLNEESCVSDLPLKEQMDRKSSRNVGRFSTLSFSNYGEASLSRL